MALALIGSDQDLLIQAAQLAGALCVLAGFAGAQAGAMNPRSLPYLVLNLAGSALLAALALLEDQWGFLLLEGCWAMVSAWSLAAVLRRAGQAR